MHCAAFGPTLLAHYCWFGATRNLSIVEIYNQCSACSVHCPVIVPAQPASSSSSSSRKSLARKFVRKHPVHSITCLTPVRKHPVHSRTPVISSTPTGYYHARKFSSPGLFYSVVSGLASKVQVPITQRLYTSTLIYFPPSLAKLEVEWVVIIGCIDMVWNPNLLPFSGFSRDQYKQIHTDSYRYQPDGVITISWYMLHNTS